MLGRTISHYVVTGKLGVGGMGVVYDAMDTRLSRRVALKFLPDDLAADSEAALRLLREAETIAQLSHPNICTIYGIEHDGELSFIAMERLDGTNLKLRMARGRLTTAEVLDVALQVTDALAAAHAQGIVHRDIKPGNIFVCSDGRVKVLDFGLARRFMLPDTGELVPGGSTMPGRPLGTANYMAPERILQLPLDPRCDLFSLGVVIYEMATGRLPFAAASPADTIANILEKQPEPLNALAADRPAALSRIVSRLLAKRAGDRFSTAGELRGALAAVPTDEPRSWWRHWFGG
jgi:non-specific serine/threonine protein kinase